jgi:SAM-dependent methyltransferase
MAQSSYNKSTIMRLHPYLYQRCVVCVCLLLGAVTGYLTYADHSSADTVTIAPTRGILVQVQEFYDEAEQIAFWDRWLASQGGEWRNDFLMRTQRHPLSKNIHPMASNYDPNTSNVLRILDVAPGPLTHVGTEWAGGKVELRVIDPNAREYIRLLNMYNIHPPVAPEHAAMTEVARRCGNQTFDVIIMSDSLRKSANPMETLLQCARLLRPGGHMVVGHSKDKALWHLEEIEGSAIFTYNYQFVNISAILSTAVNITIDSSQDTWVSMRLSRYLV